MKIAFIYVVREPFISEFSSVSQLSWEGGVKTINHFWGLLSAPVHSAVSGVESGQRRMSAFFFFLRIVFISPSLMPDLTSGLEGVRCVRQKCTESERRCAGARVSGGRMCVPHVILRCRAVVPAAQRTPRSINHTYRLCACVCDSGANTCYQSAPVRAAQQSVDVFTRLYAHMWTRTCAQTGRDHRTKGGGVIDGSAEVRRTLQRKWRGESSNKKAASPKKDK